MRLLRHSSRLTNGPEDRLSSSFIAYQPGLIQRMPASAFGRRRPEYVSVTDMKIEIKSSHALQFQLVVHMSWLPRPAPATPS